MKIRPAKETDVQQIMDIYNHAILHTTSAYRYEPYTLENMLDWYDKKQGANLPILVCELENKTIGYATYGAFRDKPSYRFTVEHSVYIHKDHRGKGIGKQLLKELIEIARSNDMHTMIGGIDSQNDGSRAFHEKMGFEQVAHFKEVGYKFDQWLSIYFYQLIL